MSEAADADEPPPGPGRFVAVVTGGSDGIGYELARAFARDGNALLLVARGVEGLEDRAERLRAEFGVSVRTVAADLATAEGCEAVAAAIAREGLQVEYLVNNAGIGNVDAFAEEETDKLIAMIDLNVRAVTDLMRRFLPGMIARGRGGVLNMGSLAGFAPGPYQSGYYASKAYVISLTQAVAHEVRGTGVRVAVVCPGPVATRFHARAGGDNAYYLYFGMMRPRAVAEAAHAGFMRGRVLIVPGLINKTNRILLQLMPRWLLTPFMGLLLRQRQARPNAGRDADAGS